MGRLSNRGLVCIAAAGAIVGVVVSPAVEPLWLGIVLTTTSAAATGVALSELMIRRHRR